jgi:type II secretory pathway component PulL
MKMPVTKMTLLAAIAVAPSLTPWAAHAQRYREAPAYSAQHYRGWNDRSPEDQRIIDAITRADESAGK